MNKVKFTLLVASIMLSLAFTFSCSSDDGGGGPNCSLNGGTVNIGSQVWMAKNLNCKASGSACYDNDPTNCDKYGRLYSWATAMTVCPSGWHLPSKEEWETLMNYIESDQDCTGCAAKHLKSASGWIGNDNNGTDTYGFAALPGGLRFTNDAGNTGFLFGGTESHWWSSSKYSYTGGIYGDGYVIPGGWRSVDPEHFWYSVRCLKD